MQMFNSLNQVQQELFDNINYLLKKEKVKVGNKLCISISKGNTNYYATAIVAKDSIGYQFTFDKSNSVLTFTVPLS